jgi:hypothetical protein
MDVLVSTSRLTLNEISDSWSQIWKGKFDGDVVDRDLPNGRIVCNMKCSAADDK